MAVPNLFLDQTRSKRIDLGWPGLDQVRVGPDLFDVLQDVKPPTMTWPTFLGVSGVLFGCIALMMRADVEGAQRLLRRIAGEPDDAVSARVTPVSPVSATTRR
jgi:hypothetical protein